MKARCLTRSCWHGSFHGSSGLISGNWSEFQDLSVFTFGSKHVFLIVSDG